LEDLNINEEDVEDNYDFMNDPGVIRSKTRGTTRHKSKYMNILQDVADRTTSHISIDLDDLDTVRITRYIMRTSLRENSTKSLWVNKQLRCDWYLLLRTMLNITLRFFRGQ